ncbi:CsaB protein [Gracilibacillus boraciitolerans JCM 21714]|uniref:CsaB protein n=1 Tax=Gracilibacillus boraciitolerans JCM 21714 TaxID=1298598 RepID=W4VH28_9BACI|nr:polysaccharide pyruvyl transferase family protein [Gracilibacillus boraciitolerans]GAE92446.1 CsaB protein [Gracilibacillus boraciitolerans JCM 21714]
MGGYMETEARHVPVELELEEKISIIAASCMLIGMRLHSLIFASLSHTPFVAISYDPKIDSFAQLVNQPIGANVNESNWSENELYEIVNDVYENVDDYHSLLKNHVEPLKRDALQTAQLALDTFQ